MIKFKNVSLGYNDKCIIENLNVVINNNEITSIIGPNGCGKSTIIKSLSDKSIRLDGSIDFSYDHSDICTLSQINNYPKDLTVYEFLNLSGYKNKNIFNIFSKVSNYEDIDKAICLCNIMEIKYKKLAHLSGGQRQKVFLAFCLSQNPKLIILDEPATYLDIKSQFDLIRIIKKLRDILNITIICIHHDIEQVLNFSDKVIIINENRQIIIDTYVDQINDYGFLKNIFGVNASVLKTKNGIHLNYNYKNN